MYSATPQRPATSASADLVESVLASGSKSGYSVTYTVDPSDTSGKVLSYGILATPINPRTTTQRDFFAASQTHGNVLLFRFD